MLLTLMQQLDTSSTTPPLEQVAEIKSCVRPETGFVCTGCGLAMRRQMGVLLPVADQRPQWTLPSMLLCLVACAIA